MRGCLVKKIYKSEASVNQAEICLEVTERAEREMT